MAVNAQRSEARAECYWRTVLRDWQPATNPDELRDRYDFVIVGGGLTGLWAAFHILDREPTASVALLEAERVAHVAVPWGRVTAARPVRVQIHRSLACPRQWNLR